MDCGAINAATDKVLRDFGLKSHGDLIALRAFCLTTPENPENMKMILKDRILNNGRMNSLSSESKKKKKDKIRTVYFTWLKYNNKTRRYVNVRSNKGGGLSWAHIPESANKAEILAVAQKLFFDNLPADELEPSKTTCNLMAYGNEIIHNEVVDDDSNTVPFTLKYYCTKFKKCRTKLSIFLGYSLQFPIDTV